MKNETSLECFSSSSKSAENGENLETNKQKSTETDRIFVCRENEGFLLKSCFIWQRFTHLHTMTQKVQ